MTDTAVVHILSGAMIMALKLAGPMFNNRREKLLAVIEGRN